MIKKIFESSSIQKRTGNPLAYRKSWMTLKMVIIEMEWHSKLMNLELSNRH